MKKYTHYFYGIDYPMVTFVIPIPGKVGFNKEVVLRMLYRDGSTDQVIFHCIDSMMELTLPRCSEYCFNVTELHNSNGTFNGSVYWTMQHSAKSMSPYLLMGLASKLIKFPSSS